MGAKLDISRDGHIALWRISDPETRNALNGDDFFAAIERAVRDANADLDIRAVILTGVAVAFLLTIPILNIAVPVVAAAYTWPSPPTAAVTNRTDEPMATVELVSVVVSWMSTE